MITLVLSIVLTNSLVGEEKVLSGTEGTALVVLKGKTFPVLWGSTLRLRAEKDEKITFGLCRLGLLDNCDEALSYYHDTQSSCSVSTEVSIGGGIFNVLKININASFLYQ